MCSANSPCLHPLIHSFNNKITSKQTPNTVPKQSPFESMFKQVTNTSISNPSSTTTIPYGVSSKKISVSTMQEAISMLKKQIRSCKLKNAEQKEEHAQEIAKYAQEIEAMKKKILYMHEKEYLKDVLNEEEEQELQYKYSNDQKLKQTKVLNGKLENELKIKDQQLFMHKETIEVLKGQVETVQREKAKHLELGIVQKINLQERIEILQKQITSKENLLKMSSDDHEQFTHKEIKLKKIERKLAKKAKELEYAEKQLNEYSKFQVSKIKMKLDSMEEENTFLKSHINRLESKIMEVNCQCTCTKDVNMFKNKYINKSKELSKVKVELSKEMFKEKFMKQHSSSTSKLVPEVNSYENVLKEVQNYQGCGKTLISGGGHNSKNNKQFLSQEYGSKSTVKKHRGQSGDFRSSEMQRLPDEEAFFKLNDNSDGEDFGHDGREGDLLVRPSSSNFNTKAKSQQIMVEEVLDRQEKRERHRERSRKNSNYY